MRSCVDTEGVVAVGATRRPRMTCVGAIASGGGCCGIGAPGEALLFPDAVEAEPDGRGGMVGAG